jgi:hypothetical protein
MDFNRARRIHHDPDIEETEYSDIPCYKCDKSWSALRGGTWLKAYMASTGIFMLLDNDRIDELCTIR